MNTAHILTIQPPTLDLDIEALRADYGVSETNRVRLAERTFRTYLRWQLERPGTTSNDYLATLHGKGYSKNRYAYLHAGRAIAAGYDGATLAELAPIGRAIENGLTPEQITQRIAEGTLNQTLSKRAAEGTTTRRITESGADLFDVLVATAQGVSDTHRSEPEWREFVLQMLAAAPEPVWRALARMVDTGEDTMEALTKALKLPVRYMNWVARQTCAAKGCGSRSHHLHHVRLGEHTKRYRDHVIGLCTAHHMPYGEEASAHAMKQDDWATLHFGGPTELWQYIATLQADFLEDAGLL